MSPQEFAEYIRTEVVMDIATGHGDLFSLPIEKFTDPKWKKIRISYESMSEPQKEAMRFFGLQASIDTASNILGILDGSSILPKHREDFSLRYGDSDREINGNLQDYFLSSLEEKNEPTPTEW